LFEALEVGLFFFALGTPLGFEVVAFLFGGAGGDAGQFALFEP